MTHPWNGSKLALSGYFFKGRNLHEYAQTCVALGLSGVDLWPWNVNNFSPREAATILRSYSLTVMSVKIDSSNGSRGCLRNQLLANVLLKSTIG